MSARTRILAAAAAALTACGAVDAPRTALQAATERPAPAAAIRGRVVDAGGRPLEGVQVLVAPVEVWSRADQGSFDRCLLPPERQTRTDADGRFELGLAEPGLVRVLLRRRGFMEIDVEGEWVAPETTLDLGEVALVPGARVSGRVVDEQGRPIEGARLARTWEEGSGFDWVALDLELARTDADGRFRTEVLRPEPAHLTVSAPGFHRREFRLDVPREGAALPDGTLPGWGITVERGETRVVDGELHVTLGRGPTIRGRVEAEGALRAPWVLVHRIAVRPERVDWNGRADVDFGRARDASAPDLYAWAFVPVAADGTFTAGAFATPEDDLGSLAASYAASPVALTPVARWEPRIEPLGPTVTLAPDELDREVVLSVAPVARAGLRVVDAEDGRPLEELAVLAAPRGWAPRPIEPRESPDGRVELELRAAELDLWIAAPGYLPLQREGIALAPGGTTELGELALERAPMLALRVFDATTREPIAGATIDRGTWSRERRIGGDFEPNAFRTTTTDAEGRARIVHGGELWIHAEGYEDLYDFQPQRAGYRRISLEPAPRVEVRVLVTHADGTPAARWPLVVDGRVSSPVLTDEHGRAEIDGPVREVEAWTLGYWSDEVDPSPWEATRAELDPESSRDPELHLRLPELVPLELTVLEGGRPVPGARVGPAHWSAVVAPTDGRGRVLGLRGAIPGPLHVQVWRGERSEPAVVELVVSRDRPTQLVDLAPPGSNPR